MNFDPAAKKYTYYQHDPLDLTSLSINLVSSLFIDRTGILWVGTSGQGINIYDHKANRFPILRRGRNNSSRITGFSVSTIFEDRDGFVWISADVLYRWNRITGVLKSFETNSNRANDFGNTGAYSIIQASNGMIWMASARGLFKYNPITQESKLYRKSTLASDSTGLLYPEVNAVYEDQKGTIWIATKNYFSKMTDSEEGSFKHFRIQESYSSKNMTRPVIYQDEKEIFWIGTANGLVRFDPDSKETLNFLTDPSKINSISNNTIKSITPDPFESDKYLWIGTSGGLNKFDKLTGTFEHYTEDDGLPNNVVYGILSDNRGCLWLSTNKGLSRFDLQTETFRNYDVRDGLQSNEFNTGAYYRSRSGELFFGGIAGLNYFFPDSIKDNPHKPEIVLTGLKIGEESISHKKHPEITKTSITESKNILLSHKDDVISFDFAALDYSSPDKNRYAYKLDGFNDDWIYSGHNTSATYTNLPHGEFTFRVKGSNNDGVWNEEGTSMAIIITPPWWQTWWAYIIEAQTINEARNLSIDIPSILTNAEIVLIVEDNDEVRTFIKEQLENDYKILGAGNGVEGITISQNEIPDLIITGLMMPEMDGYDFCKSIRSNEKTSHIPLVMLTAKAGLDHKLVGLETGIDAFLAKPFKVKELQVRVRKLIQQRKKLREQFGQEAFIQPSRITDISIDQRFWEKVIASVEKHFKDDQFKVDDLAAEMNMSTSQLNRKLNALIGQPAGKLINSLKLERAANLLKQSDQTVAEISYKIGYSDQAYFSRVFKKQFGESPSEFRDN